MAQTRFTCTLTTADEPPCQSYARATIVDSEVQEPADVLVTQSPRSTDSQVSTSTGPTPKASTRGAQGP
jgi:hypothetical protein